MTTKANIAAACWAIPVVAVLAYRSAPAVCGITVIVWVMVGLPYCLLVSVDWFRTSNSRGGWAAVGRVMVRAALFPLGLLGILFGLGIAVFAVCRLCRGDSAPLAHVEGLLVLPLVLVAFGAYCLRLSFGRRRSLAAITAPPTATTPPA